MRAVLRLAAGLGLSLCGKRQEIPNDFVWIFAGGTPPNDFLKKLGVQLGTQDLTSEARDEAQQAKTYRKQLAPGNQRVGVGVAASVDNFGANSLESPVP